MPLKFVFIVGCFAIAGMTYFFCKSKKDWAWLTLGLLFTLGADYFLVVRNLHIPGVAVFCFAHICYIMRATAKPTIWSTPQAIIILIKAAIAGIIFATIDGALIILSGIYAALFITNIVVNFKYQKINRPLVITGLILFSLCDINVALFNLPRHFELPFTFSWAFTLIWVFYLPSQLLLSVSAIAFPSAKE